MPGRGASASAPCEVCGSPHKEKESDFVFPHNPEQEKPTVLIAEPKSPPFAFEQRGGFVNDASHLNKTAVYGVVRITSEGDIRNCRVRLIFDGYGILLPSSNGQPRSIKRITRLMVRSFRGDLFRVSQRSGLTQNE